MQYKIEYTSRFKKEYKLAKKRGRNISLLRTVIDILAKGEPLPEKYRDHSLVSNWTGYRECQIQGDWWLIYQYQNDELILSLTATGTHSDLF